MSDEEDYNSEEDVDYVPSEGEQVSEEEHSGEEEDLTLLQDDDGSQLKGKKNKKSSGRKRDSIAGKKRKGGIKLDENNGATSEGAEGQIQSGEEAKRKKELAEQIAKEDEEKKKEREKRRTDDLWSSFMSDVKKPVRNAGSGLGSLTTQVMTSSDSKPSPMPKTDKAGKITITTVFDFAGEEVKITKEVDANSKEAKAEQKKHEEAAQNSFCTPIVGPSLCAGVKRPAVGGLGSVLSKINKKSKMGTLEKSKIDWDSFKRTEGINEDLKIYNKGKQGYTERVAFLNRADQRQYEIERDLRLGTSSKR